MDLKLLTLLLLFGALKIHTSSVSNYKILQSPSKLPSYVCRIVHAVNRKNADAKNIAIAVMENKFRENIIDEIIKCMPKLKVFVNVIKIASEKDVTNLNENEKLKATIRNADVVIIVTDKIIRSQLLSVVNNFNSFPLLNFMSKFLIVTSNQLDTNRNDIAASLIHCSIFNFAIIFEVKGNPHVEVINHFMNTSSIYTTIPRWNLADVIFPDKLKDLNGYKYKGLVYRLFAHTDSITGETTSKYLYFLKHIAKIQNADVEVQTILPPYKEKFLSEVRQGKVDLILNEVHPIHSHAPKLLTYEQNDFCALIPKRKGQFNEVKSLDSSYLGNALMIFVPILLSVVLWRLYKNRGANDSHWRFLFALYASLVQQSVRLRNNRLILAIMLQMMLICLHLQSLIKSASLTSFISTRTIEVKYKTFDDLFRSNENEIFQVDSFFNTSMNDNHLYQSLRTADRIKILGEQKINNGEILVLRCKLIEVYKRNGDLYFDAYDLLSDKKTHFHNELEAGYLNSFLVKLQEYMTWSFEAGLSQIWDLLYQLKAFGIQSERHRESTNIYMTMKELRFTFIIISGLFFISFIIFLWEIFYHDFVSKLSFQWIRGIWWKNLIYRRKKQRNVRRVKAKFIRVQPIDV